MNVIIKKADNSEEYRQIFALFNMTYKALMQESQCFYLGLLMFSDVQ